MDTLLIFFAFPIGTIIISAILQKILRRPVLVAAFVFAVFLIVTFAAFDETFLIATLVYTIIALITAFAVSALCRRNHDNHDENLLDRLENLIEELENANNGANNGDNNDTDNENSNCGCNRSRYYRYRRF